MNNIEVEICRRFDHPDKRITAMRDYVDMVNWLTYNAPYKCCQMCRIEGDYIVWRFGPWHSNDNQSEFNRLFSGEHNDTTCNTSD